MKKFFASIVVLLVFSVPAFAGCDGLQTAIERTLKEQQVTQELTTKVNKLRKKADKHLKSGQHSEGVALLQQAMDLLTKNI